MGVVGNEPNPKSRKKEASYLRLGRKGIPEALSGAESPSTRKPSRATLESLQGIPGQWCVAESVSIFDISLGEQKGEAKVCSRRVTYHRTISSAGRATSQKSKMGPVASSWNTVPRG